MLGLIVLLPGCAYYNTFYYAKKYFAKAQRIERDARTDRLSPEAVGYYDRAIEKCVKVIVDHGGGWRAGIDDALFLMGASYYGKREYETAIGKFNELIFNYPDSDHTSDALFYSGLCYQRMHNFGTAGQIFDSLLREYPDFRRRDEILLITAETLATAGDEPGARTQYERLLREFPNSERREEALRRLGEIHFEAGRYDSALIAYQRLARATRDDELYFEAQLKSGAALVSLGEVEDALDIYERILPDNPEREEAGGQVWLAMAKAENRAGDHAHALEHLGLVNEHFANRGLGVEALFLIGYTHEVYLRQYAEAQQAYQEAVGARTRSVFREQANRRLENITYLIELEQAGELEEETDLERRANASLKVAEFTLFEGRDPRSALTQYEQVVREHPGSAAALRARYAQGWILARDLDSLDAARAVLDTLIQEDPSSSQAEGALVLLADLDVPAARLALLEERVAAAQAIQQAQTDSLARAQAEADSLTRAEAQADSVTAHARAEARQRDATESEAARTLQAEATTAPDSLAAPEVAALRDSTALPDSLALPDSVVLPDSLTRSERIAPPDSLALPGSTVLLDSLARSEVIVPPDSLALPDSVVLPDSLARSEVIVPPDSTALPDSTVLPDSLARSEVIAPPDSTVLPDSLARPPVSPLPDTVPPLEKPSGEGP